MPSPCRADRPAHSRWESFEVSQVVFSQDRKRLVYSSNQDDTDRSHIWTVDVEHGSPVRTDQSHAIEDTPQIGADGALYALQSDGNQPLHPVVLSAEGQWRRLAPGSHPILLPEFQARHAPGRDIYGEGWPGKRTRKLFLPRETTSKPHPAILFFHGGPSITDAAGVQYQQP